MALTEMRRRYNEYLLAERNLSVLTAYSYQNNLDSLERFLTKDIEAVTAQDLRRYLRESPLSPSTKNGVVNALKSFHRWGALEEMWPLNGIIEVIGPHMVCNPKESLSTGDALVLLETVKRSNETRLIYLGLFGGLRVSEIARIDADSWRSDKLRFLGKGRKVREVPVHPELEAKRDVILSNSTTSNTLKQVVRALVYATDIAFSSHTLRRTFAVHLSEALVQREVIGSILGHAPLSVTETYAPVRWGEKQEAIAALSYEGAMAPPSRLAKSGRYPSHPRSMMGCSTIA